VIKIPSRKLTNPISDLLQRHSARCDKKNPSPPSKRVNKACVACASSKTRCGDGRPCPRCKRKGTHCTPQSTNNTNPAQALAGTSNQNLNAPQSRHDEPEGSLDWAQPPSSTNPIIFSRGIGQIPSYRLTVRQLGTHIPSSITSAPSLTAPFSYHK